MPMLDRPSPMAPSPVAQNILPPAPQAPPPNDDLNQAAPPKGPNMNVSEQDHVSFDAPIPGQSLTDTPGNAPWEHPPQYTKPQEAAEKVWELLNKPKNVRQIIVMLHNGVPIEAIARTVLFGGFSQGKWSPDVALLIAKPVTYMIAGIAARAQESGALKSSKVLMPNNDPDPVQMMADAKVNDTPPDTGAAKRQDAFINGFLPRKKL